MTKDFRPGFVAVGLLAWSLAAPAVAADDSKGDAKAAFARLKTLAGEWKVAGEGDDSTKVAYKVTANASAVMETMFPGSPHEMVTMYHLDGDDLRLTHYCASGNQPRLKLDPKASKGDTLEFAFEGGTNLDPAKDRHMHSGRITFKDASHVEAEWDGYDEGKKTGSHKFVMSRP